MQEQLLEPLPRFLERLGLDEEPMGVFYTDEKPLEGFSPQPIDLPTREKEMKNEIDWQDVFSRFSCAMGHIWRARKKRTAAYFSARHFGCPGGAFWMGFNKPQAETIIKYVSTGIPNWTEGENYCDSPDELRRIFEYVDPRTAPHTYCVVKPIRNFSADETISNFLNQANRYIRVSLLAVRAVIIPVGPPPTIITLAFILSSFF